MVPNETRLKRERQYDTIGLLPLNPNLSNLESNRYIITYYRSRPSRLCSVHQHIKCTTSCVQYTMTIPPLPHQPLYIVHSHIRALAAYSTAGPPNLGRA